MYTLCSGEGQGKEVLDEEGHKENHLGSPLLSNCKSQTDPTAVQQFAKKELRVSSGDCESATHASQSQFSWLCLAERSVGYLSPQTARARRCKATLLGWTSQVKIENNNLNIHSDPSINSDSVDRIRNIRDVSIRDLPEFQS